MLVRFEEAVEVWLTGELSISLGIQYITVPARVARVDGREAGLSFRIKSDDDRLQVKMLLDAAEEQGGTSYDGSL